MAKARLVRASAAHSLSEHILASRGGVSVHYRLMTSRMGQPSTTRLTMYGRRVRSVFALAGYDENSATYAVGWALAHSPLFARELLRTCGVSAPGEPLIVDMQRHESGVGGFTDLELRSANAFHIIVEAKAGWTLPTQDQLRRYAGRFDMAANGDHLIVTLSSASREYSLRRLPTSLEGVRVDHFAWSDLISMARASAVRARGNERLWLDQLATHLKGYASMQPITDNSVYVVALAKGDIIQGTGYTWIDVVKRDCLYFHPYGTGGGWPVIPPNYLGFRYDGRLQAVCHVDSYEIVQNLADVNPNWPTTDTDHIIYKLGPVMRPTAAVPTGNLFRNARVWCAIDTLLSGAFESIRDASDETKRRLVDVD